MEQAIEQTGGLRLGRLVLLVGTGDQLLQTADLLLVHLLRLLKHLVGIPVGLAAQTLEQRGQQALLRGEFHHAGIIFSGVFLFLLLGCLLLFLLLLGRRFRLLLSLARRGSALRLLRGIRILRFLLRRGDRPPGEGQYLALRLVQGRVYGDSGAYRAAPGAILSQDIFQRIDLFPRLLCGMLRILRSGLIGFFFVTLAHKRLLGGGS